MKKIDAHRVIRLIVKNPKRKWKFTVGQHLQLKFHVDLCQECQTFVDKVLASEPPRIGFKPNAN